MIRHILAFLFYSAVITAASGQTVTVKSAAEAARDAALAAAASANTASTAATTAKNQAQAAATSAQAAADIAEDAVVGLLPPPTTTVRGGAIANSRPANNFVTGLSTVDGSLQFARPAAADITGLAPSATTDATNAVNIATGTLSADRLPRVATNAVLAATPTSAFPNGVWREDFSAGFGAGALWFTPLTGTCAANAQIVGAGSCVNTTGGNSWRAWQNPAVGFNVLQWGVERTSADPTTIDDPGTPGVDESTIWTNLVDFCGSVSTSIVAAVPSTGGTIYFPPGNYKCGGQIAPTDKSIGFVGDRAGADIWFTNAAANSAGFNINQVETEWTRFENLVLHTTVNQVNGNECIKIAYDNVYPKGVVIRDVKCLGTAPGVRDRFWTVGIHLKRVSTAEISNVVINGIPDCDADPDGAGPMTAVCRPPTAATSMKAGIWLDTQSTGNNIQNAHIYFAEFGNLITGASERSYWTGSDIVAVSHGWFLDDDTSGDLTGVGFEAGPSIHGSHCAAFRSCVTLKGRAESQVIGNDFYKRNDSEVDFIAVDLQTGTFNGVPWGSTKGTFANNTLQLAGRTPSSQPPVADITRSVAFRLGSLEQQNNIIGNIVTNTEKFLDAGNGTLFNSITNNSWSGAASGTRAWVVNPNPNNDVHGNSPPDLVARLLEVNSATPTVGGRNTVNFLTQNSSPTSITQLVGGIGGDLAVVAVNDANTTFVHGSNLLMRDSSNVAATSGDVFTFIKSNNTATQWREIARSRVNNTFLGTTSIARLSLTASGVCTMVAGTCSAQSLGSTHASAPRCFVTHTGTGTLAGDLRVASTTTTATPSSSNGADTAQVNWVCIGP